MADLPCAESRYPEFPGLAVAERAVFAHLGGFVPHDPMATADALRAFVSGLPTGQLEAGRPTKVTRKKVAADAFVNDGRWLVRCPLCIHAAQFAPLTDPRFFCVECQNAAVAGDFIRVRVPDAATRQAIDTLLLKVPVSRCRNWLPHETVDELAVQVHDFNERYEAQLAALEEEDA